MTINDSQMKIYKWVPISNSDQKKKILKNGGVGVTLGGSDNKENARKSSIENSQTPNFGLTTEDSNTCKFNNISPFKPYEHNIVIISLLYRFFNG